METSLTFILNDTISCTSSFLLPVKESHQTIRLLQNACYLKRLKSKVAKHISVFDTHPLSFYLELIDSLGVSGGIYQQSLFSNLHFKKKPKSLTGFNMHIVILSDIPFRS